MNLVNLNHGQMTKT